jgi:DNA-directed RNA polymerase specialized sigma24 family protein
MTGDPQARARKAARRAHADFERGQEKLEQLRETRRKSFEEAQAAGLSMREIARETGLHFTRVAQILSKD